jgi:hypothetical protein
LPRGGSPERAPTWLLWLASCITRICGSCAEMSSPVIWSPNLGVFAVAAAGVLCAFPASWTRYLDSVSAVGLALLIHAGLAGVARLT